MKTEEFKKDLLENLCRNLVNVSAKENGAIYIDKQGTNIFEKYIILKNKDSIFEIKDLSVKMKMTLPDKMCFTFRSDIYNFRFKLTWKKIQ